MRDQLDYRDFQVRSGLPGRLVHEEQMESPV